MANESVDLEAGIHVDNAICDPRAKGAENTVYCPAQRLQKLGPVEKFTFRNDRVRSMMVWRWMVFYRYIPGNSAELESQRAELRQSLGFSSPEYGQKLGWFLNKQFKTFKERGLIYQLKDRQPAIYHKETDRWLSKDWDGEIRDQEERQEAAWSSKVATTPTTPGKALGKHVSKRSDSDKLHNKAKRQKIPAETSEAAFGLTDIVIHSSLDDQAAVLHGKANASTVSAGLENPTETESAPELCLRSFRTTGSVTCLKPTTTIEQRSTTVPLAAERSEPRESTTLMKTPAQDLPAQDWEASCEVARLVNPIPVVVVDGEAGLVGAAKDRSFKRHNGAGCGSHHDVVAAANAAQHAIISTSSNGFSAAQLLYTHSPYSTRIESQCTAAASQGAEPIRERYHAVEQQVLERSSDLIAGTIGTVSSVIQPINLVVSLEQPRDPPDSEHRIAYDEATLLKDCFVICLFRDGLRRGEYEQYNGLISEYEHGWWQCYLANFRNSEIRDTAYIQAKLELSSLDSPLRSRQDFEQFLIRWRGLRSGLVASIMSPSAEAKSTMQLQSIPLIPDLQDRRQYEDWCGELDDYKKALSTDESKRQILEDGISRLKSSIEEIEVLTNLAKNATEEQRQVILQLRKEMKESKERDLQVLVSESEELLEAIQGRKTVIENLEQKKRLYVSRTKSRLEELEAIVNYLRQLSDL
jgi:hypothetical protein